MLKVGARFFCKMGLPQSSVLKKVKENNAKTNLGEENSLGLLLYRELAAKRKYRLWATYKYYANANQCGKRF